MRLNKLDILNTKTDIEHLLYMFTKKNELPYEGMQAKLSNETDFIEL
jgi:hypothetical protein